MGCPNTRLATRLLSREAVAQPYIYSYILSIFCNIFAPTYMHFVSWLLPIIPPLAVAMYLCQRSFVQNVTNHANPHHTLSFCEVARHVG